MKVIVLGWRITAELWICSVSYKVSLVKLNAFPFSGLKFRDLQAMSFIFLGDGDDWDKSLKQGCWFAKILIPLLRATGFLCWALSKQTPFLICSHGHAMCLCFMKPSVFQNHWYKGLGKGSRASCIEQRSNTLRWSTDVWVPLEVFQTSENRFHNIHRPVLLLPCVKN